MSDPNSNQGILLSDGFQLQYKIEGKGIPAIVVGSSLYYDRTFSKELREHLKIYFLDHRGFAPSNSNRDKSTYELNLLLEDIELARKEFGLEQFLIIGHSGHGFLALEYAKKYPARVLGVVMMCLAPSYSYANHAESEKYLADSVDQGRKEFLAGNMALLGKKIEEAPEKAFITYCLLTGAKSWYDYKFDASSLWEGVEVNMTMFDYVWGEVFRDIDITQGLAEFHKPVFLALGRYDFLVPPPYTWNAVRDLFANLTVRIFEKSSHAPHFEESQSFDKELLDWSQGIGSVLK
ncbi:alpha/beta fold hydrolase [Leptospira idonii]|uniref:Alpha/beta hydrolase n=1 Tax=Leptospira idonii TaxID=1193500 RepID=A0A4V3JY45_9LEPT|nr:alpha/beta hydrolase [Leptospira idonii]TGN19806.1 alpha/beta hydrolase [Leptospira idonii]